MNAIIERATRVARLRSEVMALNAVAIGRREMGADDSAVLTRLQRAKEELFTEEIALVDAVVDEYAGEVSE